MMWVMSNVYVFENTKYFNKQQIELDIFINTGTTFLHMDRPQGGHWICSNNKLSKDSKVEKTSHHCWLCWILGSLFESRSKIKTIASIDSDINNSSLAWLSNIVSNTIDMANCFQLDQNFTAY